ncbi:MAG: DUF72 domain-containing protein [Syntrophobacteraceae bacterium]
MQLSKDLDLENFYFRGLHPKVFIGTASDRYSGWIGQIYSQNLYEQKITRRLNRVGKNSFKQEVLPIESVKEYFEHFRVLELDYTFYEPLLNENQEPTRNYKALCKYRKYLSEEDYLILKVPQIVSAQKIRRGAAYEPNPHYLNPEIFYRRFYKPANTLLGENLRGFIFEQEYQRSAERSSAKELAESLDSFFDAVPTDDRYHIELRTESYLVKPVFDVFERHGIGQVFSHWTWLPALPRQFEKADRRLFNSGGQSVIRLMTPRGIRYEDAYATAYPFDKLIDGLFQPAMINEAVDLMHAVVDRGNSINVIVNNRSGGNAPLIARQIASRFPE